MAQLISSSRRSWRQRLPLPAKVKEVVSTIDNSKNTAHEAPGAREAHQVKSQQHTKHTPPKTQT